MSPITWPVVTCTACGATGPGRPRAGLCKGCYARAQHPVQPCGGCGQTRRRPAAGLCARCYRLSRTRMILCSGCGQERPVYFGDRCERCKRRAAAPAGPCADCGKQVERLWSGRCTPCRARFYETAGACRDCGDLTRLTSGLCRACRLFRWAHPPGLCPYCGRWQPVGAAGACRSCAAAARATARARRQRKKKATARPPLSPASQQLLETLTGYGQARGWSPETQRRARRSLTAVLASGHDLGQPPWDTTAVRGFLISRGLKALRAVEFLTGQGLARDPQDVLAEWITGRLAALPAPFAAEVRIWADALQGQGARAGRPRSPRTIQGYLRILQPALADWAARYASLRQVTTGHLRTWLHVRAERWPATANPHLLINQSTAGGTRPVTRGYVQASLRRAGITAQDLRADRLLAEAHASGGGPLQLTRLFGISDPTAIRYCAELEQITAASAKTPCDSVSLASRHDLGPATR